MSEEEQGKRTRRRTSPIAAADGHLNLPPSPEHSSKHILLLPQKIFQRERDKVASQAPQKAVYQLHCTDRKLACVLPDRLYTNKPAACQLASSQAGGSIWGSRRYTLSDSTLSRGLILLQPCTSLFMPWINLFWLCDSSDDCPHGCKELGSHAAACMACHQPCH